MRARGGAGGAARRIPSAPLGTLSAGDPDAVGDADAVEEAVEDTDAVEDADAVEEADAVGDADAVEEADAVGDADASTGTGCITRAGRRAACFRIVDGTSASGNRVASHSLAWRTLCPETPASSSR
jgi:hypothetical protein